MIIRCNNGLFMYAINDRKKEEEILKRNTPAENK